MQSTTATLVPYQRHLRIAMRFAILNLRLSADKDKQSKTKQDLLRSEEYINLSESDKDLILNFAKVFINNHDFTFALLGQDKTDQMLERDILKALEEAENEKISVIFQKMILKNKQNKEYAALREKTIIEPLLKFSSVCTSISKTTPSPFDIIFQGLMLLSHSLARIGHFYLIERYDPDLKGPASIKYAGSTTALTAAAFSFVGIVASLVLAKTLALPLLAIGTMGFCVSNGIGAAAAIRDLYREKKEWNKMVFNNPGKKKEIDKMFRWRLLDKVSKVTTAVTSSAFYACASIVAVAAFIALFANPVGLGALAVAIGAFAIATGAVALTSWAVSKFASKKATKISQEINAPVQEPSEKPKIEGQKLKPSSTPTPAPTSTLTSTLTRPATSTPTSSQTPEKIKVKTNETVHFGWTEEEEALVERAKTLSKITDVDATPIPTPMEHIFTPEFEYEHEHAEHLREGVPPKNIKKVEDTPQDEHPHRH